MLPVSKGADGDGIFKQAPWLGSSEGTASSKPAPGAQQAVDGRRAHPAKLDLDFSRHGRVAVSP